MSSDKRTARTAGLLYLLVILTGILSLLYVPSKLIVLNDATATFKNIIAHETIFRLSIVSELISYVAFLLLPLVLYKLLKPVDKTCALLMVVFAEAIVPVAFMNIENKFDVLTLINQTGYLNVFEADKLQAQVLLFLHYYNNGNQISSIFWGLWLLPFGYLVFKSGFLPKILGILLMFGCFGYLIDFVGDFLFPHYGETIIAKFITQPGSFGEMGICLWLLIIGTKKRKQKDYRTLQVSDTREAL